VAFRGYFALNGVEIANSSRVATHLGMDPPTNDLGLLGQAVDCALTPIAPGRLLAELAPSQELIAPGRLLATPPDGSRLYSPLLALVGDCWSPENMCFGCRGQITYDDSWPGLQAMLGDTIYRPELAPWYSLQVPESAEFGGIWVMDVKGLDGAPGGREVTEMAGSGGAPGPHRDGSRRVQFDALLVACTNAGLTHGLQWLKTQIRATINRPNSTLRYMAAHPGESAADPESLIRELHGVVMTQQPEVTQAVNASRGEHQQATMYRVQWELTATRPYAYGPPVTLPVEWDEIDVTPISWVHAADCRETYSCAPMPALFAEDCAIERIDAVETPPPTCGGCMPVSGIDTYVYEVPTFDRPFRTAETSVTTRVRNTGADNLTLQAFWRRCNARDDCDTDQWPLQVTSLPPDAELILDGITKGYHVYLGGRKRRPYGMVATPKGAPWRPPVIDRSDCWEFVVIAPTAASFDVTLSLTDREA
jgi:hypothetical protein